MLQIKFNFNNFERVCHSLAACQRHTPSSLAAVIGLSNNDVISLRSLRCVRCVGWKQVTGRSQCSLWRSSRRGRYWSLPVFKTSSGPRKTELRLYNTSSCIHRQQAVRCRPVPGSRHASCLLTVPVAHWLHSRRLWLAGGWWSQSLGVEGAPAPPVTSVLRHLLDSVAGRVDWTTGNCRQSLWAVQRRLVTETWR